MKLLAALLLLLPLAAHAASDPPSPALLASYASERFQGPSDSLYIATFQRDDENARRDAYIQLRRDPQKEVLASLHWPDRHAIRALWSPDGRYVAISFREAPSAAVQFLLFRVTDQALTPIPLPADLKLEAYFHDPKVVGQIPVYIEAVTPKWWDSPDALIVSLHSVYKDAKNGFVDVNYDANLKVLPNHQAKVLSARPLSYSWNN